MWNAPISRVDRTPDADVTVNYYITYSNRVRIPLNKTKRSILLSGCERSEGSHVYSAFQCLAVGNSVYSYRRKTQVLVIQYTLSIQLQTYY